MTQTYPMEFTMRIDMRNDAFQQAGITELVGILYDVGDRLAHGDVAGSCMDTNGNTVGGFVITIPEEEEE